MLYWQSRVVVAGYHLNFSILVVALMVAEKEENIKVAT
jgi:hypothetical protein